MYKAALVTLASAILLNPVAQGQIVFHYDSEPGDYIGQGLSATWTDLDGNWNVTRNFDNGVSFFFSESPPGNSWWSLDFAAPGDIELSPGAFLNAERFPFQAAGRPGLSVTGEGRGCNTLTGEFTVTEALYDWYGDPVRFAASFEQHCEGAVPALTGTIDYDLGFGPGSFTEGNILVVFGNRILEHTPAGDLVRIVPILESTGTPPSTTERARDLVADASGNLHLYNGTFDPVLSTYRPADGTWQHSTFMDWDTVNNTSYGGIGTWGPYVFVTDMLGNASGIVRFDSANGFSGLRFSDGTDYIDLNVGLDGRLYALRSNERTLDVFDPGTLASLGSVSLASAARAIAVNASGEIFAASWDGSIYRFDSAGAQLDSLTTGFSNLTDIDLATDGRIVVGSRFETVILTTEALGTLSFLTLEGSGSTFVAFAPPPGLFADGFESGDTSAWHHTVP